MHYTIETSRSFQPSIVAHDTLAAAVAHVVEALTEIGGWDKADAVAAMSGDGPFRAKTTPPVSDTDEWTMWITNEFRDRSGR